MKCDFSIIVPVYNAKDYLDECIESVIAQTYKNWELLLVDDGSDDGSLEVCKKYARDDVRIVVCSEDNAGVSVARNKGLDIANGKYVLFLDSDDWFEQDFLEKAIQLMGEDLLDLLLTGWFRNDIVKTLGQEIYAIGDDINESDFVSLIQNNYISSVWGNVYRRELIGNLRFDMDMNFGEDLKFVFSYLNKCKGNVRAVQWASYHYRVREGSLTDSIDMKKVMSVRKTYECLYTEGLLRNFTKTYLNFIENRKKSDLRWLYKVLKDNKCSKKEKRSILNELAKIYSIRDYKYQNDTDSKRGIIQFVTYVNYMQLKMNTRHILSKIKRLLTRIR